MGCLELMFEPDRTLKNSWVSVWFSLFSWRQQKLKTQWWRENLAISDTWEKTSSLIFSPYRKFAQKHQTLINCEDLPVCVGLSAPLWPLSLSLFYQGDAVWEGGGDLWQLLGNRGSGGLPWRLWVEWMRGVRLCAQSETERKESRWIWILVTPSPEHLTDL